MTAERASRMNSNIVTRVRGYVVFYLVLILLVAWGQDLAALGAAIVAGGVEWAAFAYKIAGTLAALIALLALFLLNVGRDIDLHNLLDRTLFRVRRETDRIIQRELIQASKEVKAKTWKRMKSNSAEVTRLFYHFANNQEVLRSLAFTYWETYFVHVYAIVFGLVAFAISVGIVFAAGRLDWTALVPLGILIFVGSLAASTRWSLVRKMYDLPVQQVREISSSSPAELKAQVEKRF